MASNPVTDGTFVTDLPEDVLTIVLSHLQPRDYLAFCQISKTVYPEYRQASFYWRTQTSNTFRLPISPLLAADGPRWYWLYKRLKTQTQLYTWGQGLKGNLGPGRALRAPHRISAPPRLQPRVRPYPVQTFERTSSSWPTSTHVPDEVGVIADLQCGGWSTSILSSHGQLYTVGIIDALNGIPVGQATKEFTRLEYLTQSTSAVRQFSSGRRHVLALTDDGEIISWDRINAKGLKIFPRGGTDFGGYPTRVAAGWEQSSAYVPEAGIIFWEPLRNSQTDEMEDSVHIKEKIVPGTARRATDDGYMVVVKHIVLEDFLVWITSDSKIYACDMYVDNPEQAEPTSSPFEVPGFSTTVRELKDIQGQFQRFGVFTASGEVLAGDVDYLKRCAEAIKAQPDLLESRDWSAMTDLLASRPRDVPALQHTGVIGLAYGDYHYHALHANGKITSYGTESQRCGSLGLGDIQAGGRFRGLYRRNPVSRGDAYMCDIAYRRGRQVWFEPQRKDWLQWLEQRLQQLDVKVDGRTAQEILQGGSNEQAAFSEWIEQEGKHWDKGPAATPDRLVQKNSEAKQSAGDYSHLGAYFSIAIAAAGWHSGALVLVDEEQAHKDGSLWVAMKQHDDDDDDDDSKSRPMPGAFQNHHSNDEEYVWTRDGFPKVRLPNGVELPGEGEARPWRDGMPTMRDLGLE
ncbi:hypothetical protein LTR47_001755 [Exophiala xenobiotica]|nr:hypothetical protein LTR92_000408 [Exophiala xenobiotica]KAK5237489.1 hypothetical protein LTR47_001755 [Exophiala xenobiotica]KAK5254593.1 hypothetical protein LTS06_001083 [Exophiala xenobiotica]KAK5354634.1 hypothetical protein LTR61_001934 [Exophiala xenobiotica]KAK5381785.1 hypothetical protein LTR11_003270 [Exophiala xenobiotica]